MARSTILVPAAELDGTPDRTLTNAVRAVEAEGVVILESSVVPYATPAMPDAWLVTLDWDASSVSGHRLGAVGIALEAAVRP